VTRVSGADGEGEVSLAPAHHLAAALENGDSVEALGLLSEQTTLWSSAYSVVPPTLGREAIRHALDRLLAMRTPTRVRVLRNGPRSAVLAAFADDDALWSLEVQIEAGVVDSIMVWMPITTREHVSNRDGED
jgi:ketosteroid isomerase-like protein